MDIALKLKRVVATIAAASLFAGTASVAIAQTFNDVPTSAWYYEYVEQLVDDGVVDAGDNYRPNDPLNRAELVKIVITAIDGLAGYEAPATPTFDDVPADAWYYDYVEAAVQLDIVNGYTDAAGNLTGMFGPSDTVNRAAATKILVNAFSVATDLDPASIFPDVTSGAWYYDYVVTAYNQSVLDGYANGYFGPADPVTRAQVAKLVVNSQNPVERVVGEGEETTPGEGATSEGALEVSLNDNTPASSTVPQKASSIDLFSFDVTAADDDVTVSQIVITRGGVGQVGDWDALYLYDGATRLTTGRTLNADTNTATFAVDLLVEAGTTTALRLVGDLALAGAGASNQHYFYIASAADVTTNAQSVAGDFPTVGNLFTIGSATTMVNDLTVTTGSAISQPTIGQMDAEISAFKLQAGSTNDIALHQISVTQNGTLDSGKMTNLRLLRGTDEVATSTGFDGDRATFVLDTPYVISKGQNKNFYIHADIEGGRTSDTIQIYLDENTDLIAIDQQYGFGAVIINNALTGFKPGAAAPLVTATNLKGGMVTITDNGPAAKQIAQNTTNVELLNYSITAGRDLTVKDMDLGIDLRTGGAGTQPNVGALGAGTAQIIVTSTTANVCVTAVTTAGIIANDMISIPTGTGTVYAIVTGPGALCAGAAAAYATNVPVPSAIAVAAGTVQEINPYALVKNVKVVDTDSGSTVQGPMTKASDGTASGPATTTYTKKFSEDYELVGGETRHLSVKVDIDQTLAKGYRLFAGINYTTVGGYIKDMAANENVAVADIVGGVLNGKTMTVTANSLAVARASTPTSQTYVKGETAVPALGIALTSGDAGDITVKKLTVRVYGDKVGAPFAALVGGAGDALGDTAANKLVSSVTLYDGNDVVAGPVNLTLVDVGGAAGYTAGTDYYKALFDNLNIAVAKGSTKNLVAKVKMLNTMTVTTYIAVDMNPINDIVAEDSDANTITATGGLPSTVGLFNCINDTTGGVNLRAIQTVVIAGTLSADSQGNPDKAIKLAGSTQQLAAKYKFSAQREAFTVNKLTIIDEGAAGAGVFATPAPGTAVNQITVKYPDINGVTQTKTGTLTGGVATLSDLGFYVNTGTTGGTIEIYADVSNRGQAGGDKVSGQGYRLGVASTTYPNTTSTFEAVGVASSTTINDTGAPATDIVTWSNETSVNPFVVRTTVPTFTKVSGLSTTLSSGSDRRLYGFTVAADSAGAVSFGRFVFKIDESIAAAPGLSKFKFWRGSTLLSGILTSGQRAFIQDSVTGDVADPSVILATNASANIIVSFNQEEVVGAGESLTYYLDATIAGVAVAGGESVDTRIATGDETTPVAVAAGPGCVANWNNGNLNTGLVYDASLGGTCGLFLAATDLALLAPANRNVIWSDGSANDPVMHAYPTVNAGTGAVTTATGTYDWTNGYLLKINALAAHSLTK
jgi:hypothetical protein